VRPSAITFGGDGYSTVTSIKWKGWGGAQATGAGEGWYVPSGDSNAQGSSQPIALVAFDLGTCRGVLAYTAISTFFPSEGEAKQVSPHLDTCLGDWVQQNCDPIALAAAATPYMRATAKMGGSLTLTSAYCGTGVAVGMFHSPGGVAYVVWKRTNGRWTTTFAGALDTGDPLQRRDGISETTLHLLTRDLANEVNQFPEWFFPVSIPN
jgi:hypothetical protein